MPIATSVMAAAAVLAALAAAAGTIVAACTYRRARQAPARPAGPPSTALPGEPGAPGAPGAADLVVLLCAIGYLAVSESLAAADVRGREMASLAALFTEILAAATTARSTQ
jgi:hypothetical protein